MAKYELIILGSPSQESCRVLRVRLEEVAEQFDLTIPDGIAIRSARDAGARNPAASIVALYFGGDPTVDADLVDELEGECIPIVPVVDAGVSIGEMLPAALHAINALFLEPADTELRTLTAAALECLGLLRPQRRVFISYRRNESRSSAVQLHDELSGRGFDVFLDTHDIRPGELFQEMLWHRLVDCDVVIVLDTKDYFGSKWTTQEFGRSLAQGIQVLRMIWPGHTPTRQMTLSDAIQLSATDFDADGRLSPTTLAEIVRRTEELRCRSVASRYRQIAGTLRIEIERIGGRFEGIGAHRAMVLTLPSGREIQAYPVVGVPTAALLNDVHDKALGSRHGRLPCLVYDHRGIRPTWRAHLEWLDKQIKEVRALRVHGAGWDLAEWDS